MLVATCFAGLHGAESGFPVFALERELQNSPHILRSPDHAYAQHAGEGL
jgi:hypothetical protein